MRIALICNMHCADIDACPHQGVAFRPYDTVDPPTCDTCHATFATHYVNTWDLVVRDTTTGRFRWSDTP